MASSGSITTNEQIQRSITLSWSLVSQSVENNTSTIAWSLKGSGPGTQWVMSGGFKVVINGVVVYSASSDYRIKLLNGTQIASGQAVIGHNADGTKSFGLSCEAGVYTYAVSVTASGTHTLNPIPRASGVSAQDVEMGMSTRITISRASSSFTHTLKFAFGEVEQTIVSNTSETMIQWTPPVSLASQIPNAVCGTCALICDTYSGGIKVGTKTCSLNVSVPAYVKPTIAGLEAIRVDGVVPSSWGVYVQSKSKVTLRINGAAGSYGSKITSYSIDGGGYASTESVFTTGVLESAGVIQFRARVFDSRGRASDYKTVEISVEEYHKPVFLRYSSQRANWNGVVADDGTYIKALIDYKTSSCGGRNRISSSIYYKKTTDTVWKNAYTSFSSGSAAVFGSNEIYMEYTYDVKYMLSDTFSSVYIQDTVSTAKVLMDFKAGGRGVAVGKVSEKDNVFELADSWELEVHGKKLIDYIYPVGSIYMSVNATSPQVLFGGTWQQLTNRFLIGAGGTYPVGQIGGEEKHLLSLAEMPTHTHNFMEGSHSILWGQNKTNNVYFSNTLAVAGSTPSNNLMTSQGYWNRTSTAGGNLKHNNMPPYLAVYMWKRTA